MNAALRGLCALLALFAGAAACSAACFPVTGSRITGRDLAVANPAFAALPATYTVALAPEPGARKTLTAAELNRLAAANHIAHGDLTEICFEMPTRRISEQEVEVVMRRSIAGEVAVELKIVELPQTDMPPGQLEFPLNGLEPAAPEAPGVQLWRGFVRYAETRKAQYWARVTVLQRFTAVVASRDLAANAAVPASALSVEERTGPLQKEKAATRIEDVAGRELKRPIKAGEPIALSALTPAWDVKRGDAVRVEVTSGEARLLLDAVAESPAREGDLVELRNPSSGKVFRARLAKGGLATLVIAPGLVSSGQKL